MTRRLSLPCLLSVCVALLSAAGCITSGEPARAVGSAATPVVAASPFAPTTGTLPTPGPSTPVAIPGSSQAPAAAPTVPGPNPTPAPATPTAAWAGPSPTAAPSAAKKPVVLGYYVPYDATSWASLQARASSLDYISAQWVTVDLCGGIGSRDDRTLLAFAKERGVKVLPSLLTSSEWLNHQLLTDPDISDNFLSEIVRYVVEMGYPGFDLDLEGIAAEDREDFSWFVAVLAEALHKRGKILTLAIPAKPSEVRTGWAGPYDYAALGKHADLILLMTYDYSWSSGPPGSIAPQEWVDRVAAYAVTQIPPEKVLIGLAFYGYDWNKTVPGRARALLYPQAAALASQHGTRIVTDEASRSGTFSYTARPGDTIPPPPSVPAVKNDIAVRTPAPCRLEQPSGPPPAPTSGPPPRPSPTPPPIQEHVVWVEDASSVAGRLQIAIRRGIGGVGAWRLGQEDPAVWSYLSNYRSGR